MSTQKLLLSLALITPISAINAATKSRPNILFAIADDISYPYMSAYGTTCLSTPAFDEVARRGILFENGYVTSPGSSPSRASILTGKYTWQIEQAGTHGSTFPSKFITYTDLLTEAGYNVGYTGKGWAPGSWQKGGRKVNPAGKEYNDIENQPPFTGIFSYDYFENFKAFLAEGDKDQPFCFWYGAKEAHRGYERDSWKKAGKKLEDAVVPEFLPDTPTIRGDVMDFAVEVEWFDSHLGKMLRYLEQIGELENTLIVVTADNGMPFPLAKATCFDAGCHVPLAICWGDEIKPRKGSVKEPVSSINFAATFLDAAGVENDVTRAMTSKSLLPWLKNEKGAELADCVYYGRERHAYSRHLNWGYPVRAIRKGDMLYVHNFEPNRWPAGDPLVEVEKNGVKKVVTAYTDIDGSPSKEEILAKKGEPNIIPYYTKATQKRGADELYNLAEDSRCMNNLALDPTNEEVVKQMRAELFEQLHQTHDTRLTTPYVWDTYPYFLTPRNFELQ